MNASSILIIGGLLLIAFGALELSRAGGLGTTLAGIFVGFIGLWLAGIGVLRAVF